MKTAALALLLLSAVLALTLSGDGKPVHAHESGVGATERVLISNLAETQAHGGTTLSISDAEIRFRVARYDPVYIISRVDLKFTGPANFASDLPFVALRSHVGTEETLTDSPTNLGCNNYAFTPDSPARGADNREYRLLIKG